MKMFCGFVSCLAIRSRVSVSRVFALHLARSLSIFQKQDIPTLLATCGVCLMQNTCPPFLHPSPTPPHLGVRPNHILMDRAVLPVNDSLRMSSWILASLERCLRRSSMISFQA